MSNEVEAAVRRELARQGRRLAPIAVVLLLVVTVLATARDDSSTDVATGFDGGRGSGATGGEGLSDGAGLEGDDGGVGIAGTAGGSGGTARAGSAPGGGTGGGPDPVAQSGVSRTGVTCDGTNRQLPESVYGALCVPQFTGDNGGATSYGVTADEIVVTYRIGDSASRPALEALGGSALHSVGFNQEGIARDMAVLVDYFNTRFELYGRKVEFVPYKGQGDLLEEYQGRSQQGAQADAARAKDLGAFADVSYAGQSQLYAEAASANGIVVFSPIYLTRRWHEARAPFSHSPMWPTGEDGAHFQANVICGAMHPGKADRSNDAVMRTKDRAFGIINAENPEYARIGEILEERLEACGAPVVRRVSYPLDVTAAAQIATNTVSQMQAAGATTVLCACDFISPGLFMQSADSQRYVPEWFLTFHWTDPFYRTYPTSQFRGQLVGGGVTEPVLDTEPGEIFRKASGGREPESPFTFDRVYQQIHMLFTGIQAAGPDLNPATMFRGLERVPDTLQGPVGPWDFGPGPSTPRRWFALGVYDPDAASNLDGERGSSIGCKGGTYVRFDDAAAFDGGLDCPL